MYTTSDFRNGLKIEYENEPYIIVEFQHVKPGKGTAFTRTKIKNLITGRTIDPTFRSGDKVDKPDIEEKEMEYLYKDDDHFYFMDTTNYEQMPINAENVGDTAKWLKENTLCKIVIYKGKPIAIDPPTFVDLLITYCEPGVRGDTATGSNKPATVETGAIVQVPLFVNEGERVRIDTRTGNYVERV
jgi:elongation factor P